MSFNNWTYQRAKQIFDLPLLELIYQAQVIHRQNFDPQAIQISTLLSIKTGSCPEDCAYCPQSAHYQTGLKKEQLIDLQQVIEAAKSAKEAGATRFCMGAAWRSPKDKDLNEVIKMIQEVKKLGLETCVTLGMINQQQANRLKAAKLDFYNHNIDTSKEYYDKIITTRKFDDRLNTLANVQEAGIKICCGGILGMGEDDEDRIKMLLTLANLPTAPESVPINQLIKVEGTPLANETALDGLDFVRVIALARVMLPKSYVRLSAGRQQMSQELQSMCFLAGANSIFYGEKLLTTDNSIPSCDEELFKKLGLKKEKLSKSFT